MRDGMAPACRAKSASGFSEGSSSRAATARAAASISAICAGKMSRNRPDTRKVTSTRADPLSPGQDLDASDPSRLGIP